MVCNTTQRIVLRCPVIILGCRRGGLPSVLIVAVGCGNSINSCPMVHTGHIIIDIIRIFIVIVRVIPCTHQAVQEIIIKLIALSGHMTGHFCKVSTPVIHVFIQLLLAAGSRLVIAQEHTVLSIIGKADIITVCISGLQQVSVGGFVFIPDDLFSCCRFSCKVSECIIRKTITEPIVADPGKPVLCIRICIFNRTFGSVLGHIMGDRRKTVCTVIAIGQFISPGICYCCELVPALIPCILHSVVSGIRH